MSNDAHTTLLTAAFDPTVEKEEGPYIRLGRLDISDETIQQLSGFIEDLEWMLSSGKALRELRFQDSEFTFLKAPRPDVFPEGEQGDRLWQEIELVLEQHAPWRELPPKLVPQLPSAMKLLRKRPVDVVVGQPAGYPSFRWETPYKTTSTRVDTPHFDRQDLWRWRLRGARSPEKLRKRLKQAIRRAPGVALSVLQENGLDYDGGFPPACQPLEVLQDDDIQPLLSLEQEKHRKQALSIIARLREDPDSVQRGRRR